MIKYALCVLKTVIKHFKFDAACVVNCYFMVYCHYYIALKMSCSNKTRKVY